MLSHLPCIAFPLFPPPPICSTRTAADIHRRTRRRCTTGDIDQPTSKIAYIKKTWPRLYGRLEGRSRYIFSLLGWSFPVSFWVLGHSYWLCLSLFPVSYCSLAPLFHILGVRDLSVCTLLPNPLHDLTFFFLFFHIRTIRMRPSIPWRVAAQCINITFPSSSPPPFAFIPCALVSTSAAGRRLRVGGQPLTIIFAPILSTPCSFPTPSPIFVSPSPFQRCGIADSGVGVRCWLCSFACVYTRSAYPTLPTP
ncbi:hypothetical protein C8Q77DRAFT_199582 [Trametes polyzona]|nr:hypothetical protein C8Q77DRAFT_199582 [Trametes polyzona]